MIKMGNCVFKGGLRTEAEEIIKVVTTNGGIMELYPPITAECITTEFPGHGLFLRRDHLLSQPLLHNQDLLGGELYYLLPLNTNQNNDVKLNTNNNNTSSFSSSSSSSSSSIALPYRMSIDNQGPYNKRSDGGAEVFTRYNSRGVWKVKLVISPQQLSEILAQEARTEALIESVRTVAKCGNGAVSSVASSDQWSLSGSSLKASSDKYGSDN